jgi:hypothetical protein
MAYRQLGRVLGVLAIVLSSAAAQAQDAAAPEKPGEAGLSGRAEKFGKIFTQPFHPVVQTIASGGLLGAGVGYDFPTDGPWGLGAKAVVTPRGYWLAQFDAGYSSDRAEAGTYARMRHMNRLNFFGTGPDSARFNQTTFTLDDPVVGAFASIRVAPDVSVGARVEQMWPAVEGGRNPLLPSIEQRFADDQAPGLTAQPRFGRYQALVTVTAPASDGWGINQGGVYRVSYNVFDDQQFDQFDFHRIELEGRHKFTMFRPYHTLSVRGWVSSAEARDGGRVPFFLQHTLGGTSNIRSMHDAPLGGDGTAGTLRAFANHRFRDDHLLLLQAEYRFVLWGPLDASVFADAGKAVSRRSDLSLSDLRRDYGFSLSLMKSAETVGRIDFAFGGGEGMRVFVNFGGLLP